MEQTKTCPKCGGEMKAGILYAHMGVHKDIA